MFFGRAVASCSTSVDAVAHPQVPLGRLDADAEARSLIASVISRFTKRTTGASAETPGNEARSSFSTSSATSPR